MAHLSYFFPSYTRHLYEDHERLFRYLTALYTGENNLLVQSLEQASNEILQDKILAAKASFEIIRSVDEGIIEQIAFCLKNNWKEEVLFCVLETIPFFSSGFVESEQEGLIWVHQVTPEQWAECMSLFYFAFQNANCLGGLIQSKRIEEPKIVDLKFLSILCRVSAVVLEIQVQLCSFNYSGS